MELLDKEVTEPHYIPLRDDLYPLSQDVEYDQYELPYYGWYEHYFLQEDDGEIDQ